MVAPSFPKFWGLLSHRCLEHPGVECPSRGRFVLSTHPAVLALTCVCVWERREMGREHAEAACGKERWPAVGRSGGCISLSSEMLQLCPQEVFLIL